VAGSCARVVCEASVEKGAVRLWVAGRQVVCGAGECAFKIVRRGWNVFVRGCAGWLCVRGGSHCGAGGVPLQGASPQSKSFSGLRNPLPDSSGNEGEVGDSSPGFARSWTPGRLQCRRGGYDGCWIRSLGHSARPQRHDRQWVTNQPGVSEEVVTRQVCVLPCSDISSATVMQRSQQWSSRQTWARRAEFGVPGTSQRGPARRPCRRYCRHPL
jgi:hypothetical protein